MPNKMENKALLYRLSAEPLLIDPTRLSAFEASVAHLAQHEVLAEFMAGGMAAQTDFWADENDPWRPYVVTDGILQVPVFGVLLHRFPYQLGGWATGYEYIEQAVRRGLDDPTVRGIALVVDSPGGMVAGCFELSDFLYEARSQKPLRGYAADSAYSAAYALISATNKVSVTRSGGTGSVGVVTMHIDVSKMLDDEGMRVSLIFAGAHKVDGNPFEALPESVRDRIQARVDKHYAVFVSTVARNRDMSEDAIRATEALTYDAQDSVEVGFADTVGAMEDEAAAFASEMQETDTMTDKATSAPDAEALAAATEAGRAEGRAEGMQAQKDRITAILDSDAAKGRPSAALAAALDTDMTAEQAQSFLAKLPEEGAQEPAPGEQTNPLAEAMDKTQNPNVGSLGGDEDDDASVESKQISAILGASATSTGVPLTK